MGLSWSNIGRLWIVAVLTIVVMGLLSARERYAMTLNMSDSLPNWAFVIDSQSIPEKGDLAMLVPPENPFHNDRTFVKKIVGVAGDEILNEENFITVDGVEIGIAKPVAQNGKPLRALESQIIPEGYIFVAGTHKDSYDSRYQSIGLISKDRLIGKAEPIL